MTEKSQPEIELKFTAKSNVKFEPELGQAIFGGPTEEYPCPEYLVGLLGALAQEIERVEWNRTQKPYDAPIHNVGEVYDTDKFHMESYCWCDGEKHSDGCPPNFVYHPTGLRVRWYKYLGRGGSMDRIISTDHAVAMFDDCMTSVRALDIVSDSPKGETGQNA